MVFVLIEPSEDIDLDTIDIRTDLEIKKEASEIEGNLEEKLKSYFYVKEQTLEHSQLKQPELDTIDYCEVTIKQELDELLQNFENDEDLDLKDEFAKEIAKQQAVLPPQVNFETKNKTETSETVAIVDYNLVNGEVLFVCSICETKFKLKSELRMHVNTLHEGKGFKCSSCPALFDFNSNVKEHFKSVHGKKKAFECFHCPTKVGSKYALNKHIGIVHNGLKPFKCPKCALVFVFKKQLNFHIDKIHGKKKLNQCHFCHLEFHGESRLKRHITVVHEDKKYTEYLDEGLVKIDAILKLSVKRQKSKVKRSDHRDYVLCNKKHCFKREV